MEIFSNFANVKNAIAYIILCTILIRPLISITMISYYNLNISEIIDRYCINTDKPELKCNGKCYLSKQLKQLDNTADDKGSINYSELFTIVYFVNHDFEYYMYRNKFSSKRKISCLVKDNYNYLTCQNTTPPPKYIS